MDYSMFPSSQDYRARNRTTTQNRQVAAGALLAGLAVKAERHNGLTVFVVDAVGLPDGESFESLGAAAYASRQDAGLILPRVKDLEDRAISEETRRRRQGPGASDTPSYTRAELGRLSPEETRLEIHSVETALAAGRVSGFKMAPSDPPAEIKFTGTELKSMGPRTMASRLEEVEQALADGADDWSK